MNKIVLDASAILVLINQEKGHEIVEQHLANSIVSAVNLSEVVAVLTKMGMAEIEIKEILAELMFDVIDFDQQQAHEAGYLRKSTSPYGLSFGDRACLALAKIYDAVVLTTDRAWEQVDHFKIILIR